MKFSELLNVGVFIYQIFKDLKKKKMIQLNGTFSVNFYNQLKAKSNRQ